MRPLPPLGNNGGGEGRNGGKSVSGNCALLRKNICRVIFSFFCLPPLQNFPVCLQKMEIYLDRSEIDMSRVKHPHD